jgi:hypothetical protein
MSERATKQEYKKGVTVLTGVILGAVVRQFTGRGKEAMQEHVSLLMTSLGEYLHPAVLADMRAAQAAFMDNIDIMLEGMTKADALAGDTRDPREVSNAAAVGISFIRSAVAKKRSSS